MAEYNLTTPISDDQMNQLQAGDTVYLNGIIVTARDSAHKYLVENFVKGNNEAEKNIFDKLNTYLKNGVIYHCGPIVMEQGGSYSFVSAGPTTSIREEIYQSDVIGLFNLSGVIGKGGMGAKTLSGCSKNSCVYLHAIGGAGALIAGNVQEVVDVLKLEFGTPEAFWVVRVKDLPCLVTMDSHDVSLHNQVKEQSSIRFNELIK